MAEDQQIKVSNQSPGSVAQGGTSSSDQASNPNDLHVLYTATVTVTGGREGHAQSDDGVLSISLTKPPGLGGKAQRPKIDTEKTPSAEAGTQVAVGTNPEQLFAAGYAACFLSALEVVAQHDKAVLPAATTITSQVSLGKRGDKFELAVTLNVKFPSLDDRTKAEKNNWLDKAHHVCPYSHATRHNINVILTLV